MRGEGGGGGREGGAWRGGEGRGEWGGRGGERGGEEGRRGREGWGMREGESGGKRGKIKGFESKKGALQIMHYYYSYYYGYNDGEDYLAGVPTKPPEEELGEEGGVLFRTRVLRGQHTRVSQWLIFLTSTFLHYLGP